MVDKRPHIDYDSYIYKYDANGKRIYKKDLQKGTVTYYIYSGNDPIAEIDGRRGEVTKEFMYIMGKRVMEKDYESGKTIYVFTDHLGSIRMVMDEGTREIIWASDYTAYGEYVSAGAYRDIEHYGFTGKEHDSESGLLYYGARYYDAELGRFLQVDPMSRKYPSLSAYVYCADNPLAYTDPDGKQPVGYLNFDPDIAPDSQHSLIRKPNEPGQAITITKKDVVNFLENTADVMMTAGKDMQREAGTIPADELISGQQSAGAKRDTALKLGWGVVTIQIVASNVSSCVIKEGPKALLSLIKNTVIGKTKAETVQKITGLGGVTQLKSTIGATIQGYGAMLQLCANMIPSTSHKYIINKYDTNGNLIKQ